MTPSCPSWSRRCGVLCEQNAAQSLICGKRRALWNGCRRRRGRERPKSGRRTEVTALVSPSVTDRGPYSPGRTPRMGGGRNHRTTAMLDALPRGDKKTACREQPIVPTGIPTHRMRPLAVRRCNNSPRIPPPIRIHCTARSSQPSRNGSCRRRPRYGSGRSRLLPRASAELAGPGTARNLAGIKPGPPPRPVHQVAHLPRLVVRAPLGVL